MKMEEMDKEEVVEKRKKKKHLMSTYFSPGTSLSALYLIFTITEWVKKTIISVFIDEDIEA